MSFATGVTPSHSLSNAEGTSTLLTGGDVNVVAAEDAEAGVNGFEVDEEAELEVVIEGGDCSALLRGRLALTLLSSMSLPLPLSLRQRFAGVFGEMKGDGGTGEAALL